MHKVVSSLHGRKGILHLNSRSVRSKHGFMQGSESALFRCPIEESSENPIDGAKYRSNLAWIFFPKCRSGSGFASYFSQFRAINPILNNLAHIPTPLPNGSIFTPTILPATHYSLSIPYTTFSSICYATSRLPALPRLRDTELSVWRGVAQSAQ